jgi:hypothetical protein
MSIDVEGYELNVLQSIDFTRYRFGLITIEDNQQDGVLVTYMQEHGYKVFMELGRDILFISNI